MKNEIIVPNPPKSVRDWLTENVESFEAKNVLPSMTVPDMGMSVKEIFERQKMGLPPEGSKIPVFNEGSEFPDISRMDLIDRMEYVRYYKQEAERLLSPKEANEKVMQTLEKVNAEKEALEKAEKDVLENG